MVKLSLMNESVWRGGRVVVSSVEVRCPARQYRVVKIVTGCLIDRVNAVLKFEIPRNTLLLIQNSLFFGKKFPDIFLDRG